MPFDGNAYSAERRKRNPGKAHEYYLRTHPGAKTLAELNAEAKSRTEKACTKCAAVKPLAEFREADQRRDGRESQCLSCEKSRLAAWRTARRIARDAANPKETLPAGQKRCTKCSGLKPLNAFVAKGQPCKQCACDYAKAAYRKDPEKAKAVNREWWRNHPEKKRDFSGKAYRKAHPDSRRIEEVVAAKEAKADRAEKPCKKCGSVQPIDSFGSNNRTADGRQYQCLTCAAERERKHYHANPHVLEYKKTWSKLHPESGRHQAHKRRAREHGIPGAHTVEQWQDLCAKFQNRCVRCGKSDCKLTRDHIVPVSKPNSSNDISNIQPTCYSCNSSKNNRSIDYRRTPFINSGQQLLF